MRFIQVQLGLSLPAAAVRVCVTLLALHVQFHKHYSHVDLFSGTLVQYSTSWTLTDVHHSL